MILLESGSKWCHSLRPEIHRIGTNISWASTTYEDQVKDLLLVPNSMTEKQFKFSPAVLKWVQFLLIG